jgi:hypothetical protein
MRKNQAFHEKRISIFYFKFACTHLHPLFLYLFHRQSQRRKIPPIHDGIQPHQQRQTQCHLPQLPSDGRSSRPPRSGTPSFLISQLYILTHFLFLNSMVECQNVSQITFPSFLSISGPLSFGNQPSLRQNCDTRPISHPIVPFASKLI